MPAAFAAGIILNVNPALQKIRIEEELMNSEELWLKITDFFRAEPQDIKTAPLNGSSGKWFYVFVCGDDIIIEKGRSHSDYCNLKVCRTLDKKNLGAIYELYLERKKGRLSRSQAQKTSFNSSYWFGIFAALHL